MKQILGSLILVAALFLAAEKSFSNECDRDSISRVTAGGEIIIMLSGSIYRVNAVDRIDTMLWLPVTDVLICPRVLRYKKKIYRYYEIINIDDGEKAMTQKLR